MSGAGAVYALKVTLSHATELAASDYNGKSDPYVKFSIDDQSARSSCHQATLDPRWKPAEHFDFKVVSPALKSLRVEVYDHDIITQDDLLGVVSIPLATYLKLDCGNATESFALEVPPELAHQQVRSQVFLSVTLMPLDETDRVLELWENECWVLGSGWCASGPGLVLHRRLHWSNEDGTVSSEHFEDVAPKVPMGFESTGWGFTVGKGDPEGWLYAPTFAGPWYDRSSATMMLRRRRWVNTCQRARSSRSLRKLLY